ncbi:GABA permease [Fictibacillus gelatini]|uniref:GABA permease n=1 Tax=Fictibacillus gelatini TaxID=225985 RepID=UPI001B7FA6F5|nr:GABA permease [Fictibacillus gelatini]
MEGTVVAMNENTLQKGLKTRHMSMIAIGGVIGAGLFVGSGAVIHSTGPGAILSYILAGAMVVVVMRMLGEMVAAHPASGSFAEYAREAIGPWAGFTIGWLYWFFWVVVVAIEATAGAGIIQYWLPDVPLWFTCLVLTVLLTLTNVYSVKSFGEFEYWFSMIKVVSIIVFLLMGAAVIFGLIPGHGAGFSNLTAHGGFMPKGPGSILLGVVVVIFSFMGTEIVTIAAAESAQPQKAISQATNSVIWRILIFYVGSIAVVVTLLPWDSASILKSPYVAVLEKIGVPAAAQIMNFIVLTAVLSCLNSGLYTCSRMLYALAQKGDAPKSFLTLNRKGVPVRTILASTFFGYIAVVMNYVSPDKVFLFLVNSSGAVALLVYLVICFSQLRMRYRLEKENPEQIKIKMWLFPYLTYVTIAVILVILGSMAFIESMRSQLYLTLLIAVIVIGIYFLFNPKKANVGQKQHQQTKA